MWQLAEEHSSPELEGWRKRVREVQRRVRERERERDGETETERGRERQGVRVSGSKGERARDRMRERETEREREGDRQRAIERGREGTIDHPSLCSALPAAELLPAVSKAVPSTK